MTGAAPFVRTRDGAILGIDFRRTPLAAPEVKVPGRIPARAVMLGDTVRFGSVEGVVVTKRGNGSPGCCYIGVLSAGGAEVVHELRTSEVVHVTAVGAFDRV